MPSTSSTASLATAGIETVTVKGAIPRPKSTHSKNRSNISTRNCYSMLPLFPLIRRQRSLFGDDGARERSTIFDKLRKPGSMSSISSFLDRRKNSSHSPGGSFFKNGSSNVSKSSLISIESTRSFNANSNPWNDSGVNLPDDDTTPWPNRHFGSNSSGSSSDTQTFSNAASW